MNQSEIIELLLKVIPYPSSINKIDLSREDVVRFEYDTTCFRIYKDLSVDEYFESCLYSSMAASFLEKLLKTGKELYVDSKR